MTAFNWYKPRQHPELTAAWDRARRARRDRVIAKLHHKRPTLGGKR